MNDIARHLDTVKSTLPDGVSLVAVSKFHPAEALREAYDVGQRIFGESRVQELVAKQAVLPADIEWHFIGHLQTNKVKQIVSFISLIHSVDSPHLLAEVDRCGRPVRPGCRLSAATAYRRKKRPNSVFFRRVSRLSGIGCMAQSYPCAPARSDGYGDAHR